MFQLGIGARDRLHLWVSISKSLGGTSNKRKWQPAVMAFFFWCRKRFCEAALPCLEALEHAVGSAFSFKDLGIDTRKEVPHQVRFKSLTCSKPCLFSASLGLPKTALQPQSDPFSRPILETAEAQARVFGASDIYIKRAHSKEPIKQKMFVFIVFYLKRQ